MILTDFLRGLQDILIPRTCLLCGKKIDEESGFCDNCLNFSRNIPPFCTKCGLGVSVDLKSRVCRRCRKEKFYFTKNFSPFLFKEPLSSLIHLFKYQGFSSLGNLFSEKIIEFIKTLNLSLNNYDFLTFVPLHKRKLKEREYNQSKILAEKISQYFDIPCKEVLGVRKYLKSQTAKNLRDRHLDVKDNFYIKEDVKDKNIILLDDVFTTGATVSECSRVFKENGAKEILVLTLAIRKPDYTDDRR